MGEKRPTKPSEADLVMGVDGLPTIYIKKTSPGRAAFEARVTGALTGSLERASWDTCRRVGSRLGMAFFAIGKKRQKLAIANLQMALGMNHAQALRAARRSAQNWGMTTCEFLHIPAASEQDIRDYVSVDGLEHLEQALAGGNGAIILTAHFGNWELLGARLSQMTSVAGVVRPLSNQTMQAHMSGIRRSFGMELISKHAGARPSMKWLRKGGALFILPDRHAGPDGVSLPLFGKTTRFEVSPARLSQMTGAPIVPIWGVRQEPWITNGRIEARVLPSFTVPNPDRSERDEAALLGTRQVMASLEDIVRQHPDQWSWMLRRWRDDD